MSALLGIAGIIFSFYYVFSHPMSGFSGFFDKPSLVLLVLCPPSVMLLSNTIKDFALGAQLLVQSWFTNKRRIQLDVIDSLTRCSAKVRSEGFGALVNERRTLKYEFLRDGVSMIVNDFSLDEIQHNLQAKLKAKQSQMHKANELFENMSKLCPGVGMIGTLIGLIALMSDIKDPSSIGGGMALALITTFYGLVLGTLLYAPWGQKIAVEAEKALEIDLLVYEGVLHLKNKKSSLHLNNIMNTYTKKNESPNKRGA